MGDLLNRTCGDPRFASSDIVSETKGRSFELSGRREFRKKGLYAFRFEARLEKVRSFSALHEVLLWTVEESLNMWMLIFFVYRTAIVLTMSVLHLSLENHLSMEATDHLRC